MFSGECPEADVANSRTPVQLRGAGESARCFLRGSGGSNGLRRGDLPVSFGELVRAGERQ